MFKRLALILIASACLIAAGCQTTNSSSFQQDDKKSVSSGFNEETYIWENWIFPSNKTTGR